MSSVYCLSKSNERYNMQCQIYSSSVVDFFAFIGHLTQAFLSPSLFIIPHFFFLHLTSPILPFLHNSPHLVLLSLRFIDFAFLLELLGVFNHFGSVAKKMISLLPSPIFQFQNNPLTRLKNCPHFHTVHTISFFILSFFLAS